MKKLTTEEFIERARKVHGDLYDYSLVEYRGSKTKVKIICKIHGPFKQSLEKHSSGQGCPKCYGKNKTTEEFIHESKLVHGDKYDYSLVEYVNDKTKVKIICKHHQDMFEQTPNNHLKGKGCSNCGIETIKNKFRKDKEIFIFEAKQVHGDLYDYSLVEYKNNKEKIKIICKIHDVFLQSAASHLKGHGCSKCAGNLQYTTEEFIEKAKQIHGDLYDYSLTEYKTAKSKVKIICRKHGIFSQEAYHHLKGTGCKKCKGVISKLETKWLDNLNIPKENRQIMLKINNKKYITDAFVPKSNIVYEFLGDFWHGNPEKFKQEDINPYNKKSYGLLYKEAMDRIKLFEENGYKVVYIWENDFNKSDIKI